MQGVNPIFCTLLVVAAMNSASAQDTFCDNEKQLCVNYNCSYADPPSNFKKFAFKNYNITSLGPDMMICLHNAREIIACETRITTIDPKFFEGRTIEYLCLEFNPLEELKGNTFNHAVNLRRLDLANNKITNIWSNAFQGLGNVTTLSLAHNQIKTLDFEHFVGMTSLKHLNLAGNRLQVINLAPLGAKQEMLDWLDLSHNRIVSITSDCMIKLAALNVSGNRMMDLTVLSHFEAMKHLNLSYNHDLILLSTTFKQVGSSLETLVMDGVDLSQWERKSVLEPLIELRQLHIANASMQSVRLKSFPVLPKLEELYVHDNPVTTMRTNSIKQVCPALKKLVVSNEGWSCSTLELMIYKLDRENITVLPKRVTSLKSDHDYKEFRGIRCKRIDDCPTTGPHGPMITGFWVLLAATLVLVGYSIWTSMQIFQCRRSENYSYYSMSVKSFWAQNRPEDQPNPAGTELECGYTVPIDAKDEKSVSPAVYVNDGIKGEVGNKEAFDLAESASSNITLEVTGQNQSIAVNCLKDVQTVEESPYVTM